MKSWITTRIRTSRRLSPCKALLAAAALLVVFAATAPTAHAQLVSTGESVDLSGIRLVLHAGTPDDSLDLASLRGKTVLLDFWTSWCRPCIQEIPETNTFAEAFADREDFVFLSVNQDAITTNEGLDYVRTIVDRHDIEYPVLYDWEEPSLKRTFGIRAWPTRVMIDPDGNILDVASGRLSLDDAAAYLSAGGD